MRLILILLALILEIQLYFTESYARHQQESSNANNMARPKEKKVEEEVDGPIKEVLAQTGGTARIPCKLSNPGAGTVTWVRRKDRHLLTVGTSTHTVDNRFMIKHVNSDWTLLIQKVTFTDAGLYECQVTSHPVQRHFARLQITEAYSVIPGAPDFYVRQGSSLRLECRLMSATEPPVYVFWYRQGRMINYDSEPGVKVEFNESGSILTVNNTKPNHGGNYTCAPSNAKPAFVVVHVIEEEEKPAAMHGGDRRNLCPAILASNFLVSFLATVSWRIPSFTSLYPT